MNIEILLIYRYCRYCIDIIYMCLCCIRRLYLYVLKLLYKLGKAFDIGLDAAREVVALFSLREPLKSLLCVNLQIQFC